MHDTEWLGRRLDGRYEVKRLVRRGGMGAVYQGVRLGLDKLVAIKVAGAELQSHSARLLREARMMAKINHANVCRVFDLGAAGEAPYIVMEWLGGESAHDRLLRGRFSIPETQHVIGELLSAVEAVHAAGLIHRDVKPANVMLCEGPAPTVKLIDFGLARRLDAVEGDVTRVGIVVGTPHYMAPEAIRGLTLDERCDVYSVGALAHHMLSGAPPVRALGEGDLFRRVARGDVDRLVDVAPHVPSEICDVVERALSKRPEDRFQSAAEFRRAWDALPRYTSFERAPRHQSGMEWSLDPDRLQQFDGDLEPTMPFVPARGRR